MSVFANNRKIAHKGNGQVETCPVPDVCKTPSPGGPIPIPYVNVANDSDLADGTKDVKIEGNMVAHKPANLAMSTGDEAGSAGGGLVSSKIKGKMHWAMSSMDVKFEGEGVIRFMDPTLHNGNADNTANPAEQGGFDGSYPGLDEKADCPKCGKAIHEHDAGFEIPQSDQTKKKAKQLQEKLKKDPISSVELALSGRMVGVMTVNCNGTMRTLAGISGSGTAAFAKAAGAIGAIAAPIIQPEAFMKKFKNQVRVPDARNGPGNCAAPRMIAKAKEMGCTPVAMTEVWAGAGDKDGHRIESCPTCKVNLPKLLCPDPDKPKPKKPKRPMPTK